MTGFGLYTGTHLNSSDDRSLEILIDDVTYTSTQGGGTQLQPGDADMDLDFDQLDLVQVQIAAKYLSGQAATWLRRGCRRSSSCLPVTAFRLGRSKKYMLSSCRSDVGS